MTVSSTGTLDTNVIDTITASLSLTIENLITLYVVAKTGSNRNHRIILEVSPDNGATWIAAPTSIGGLGYLVSEVVATDIRAKVNEVEGATSTVTVHILAR